MPLGIHKLLTARPPSPKGYHTLLFLFGLRHLNLPL